MALIRTHLPGLADVSVLRWAPTQDLDITVRPRQRGIRDIGLADEPAHDLVLNIGTARDADRRRRRAVEAGRGEGADQDKNLHVHAATFDVRRRNHPLWMTS